MRPLKSLFGMVGWMDAQGRYDAYIPMVNGLKTSLGRVSGTMLGCSFCCMFCMLWWILCCSWEWKIKFEYINASENRLLGLLNYAEIILVEAVT
jgi:hypothetical protein